MHVVEVLVYTHLLALIHINYETEIDIDNVFTEASKKDGELKSIVSVIFSLY